MNFEPYTAPSAPPPSAPEPEPRAPAGLLTPGPLPARGLPLVLFGLAAPLIGLRVVLREPELRRLARKPVLFLLGFAFLVAYGTDGAPAEQLAAFFTALVSLAPVPVILFGKTYRNLAAAARVPLGLSPGAPVHPKLWTAIADAIRQSLLLALALVPIYFVSELLQSMVAGVAALFVWLVWAAGGAWALHWIVVEALDNGHTAPAAGAPVRPEPPDPWFVRIYQVGPLRPFARLLRRLSRPWRGELELVARRPELALGFGLGIAALLAVPLMALVFRPAAVAGAVHLLGRVDEAEAAAPTA